MKSQDIALLFKLLAMDICERRPSEGKRVLSEWDAAMNPDGVVSGEKGFDYTARGLEIETGISKTQVNLSLNRCLAVGLAFKERGTGIPRVNARALFEFIVYGIRYVFPARKGELTRGVGTAFSAPMLRGALLSAGELDLVWADAYGKASGQAVEPLFKSCPFAAERDPLLHEMLALVDAVRIGQPRESNLAVELLEQRIMGNP